MPGYIEYPEDVGISSKGIMAFLDMLAKKGLEIHSAFIIRHGKVACKMEWSPYSAAVPHTLYSLSKSFCSCAAGFAVSEGLLRYDTTVFSVLTDKFPNNPTEWQQNMTLGDLLCMGSGLDHASDGVPPRITDWCKHVLSYPVINKPGTHFDYNSFGTYLCSAIVQRVTGKTCRDYLTPRLFDKLGIAKPQWDCCPMGINAGGFGLHLSCEDIAKFGQLLLQDGIWEGQRVLPEGWVKLASEKKIENYKDDITNDWQQGYGYQFWRTRENRFRGDGMYGQICMVDEAKDTVVAITAGITDMRSEFDLIHDYLFPAIDAPAASKKVMLELQKRIKALAYPIPQDDGTGLDITGSYLASGRKRLRLELLSDGRITIHFFQSKMPIPVVFTLGCATPSTGQCVTYCPGEAPQPYIGAYGWENGKLKAVIRMPGNPGTTIAVFALIGDKLTLTISGAGWEAGTTVFSRQ